MANTHAKMEMEQYKAFVRKVIVAKPGASLAEIQRQLVANNLPKLHVDTISKIRNKLLKERVHRMNRTFLAMRLGEQQDVRAEILNHAWGILLQPEDNNQKMSAMRLILQEEHEWTKLLILVGILDQGDKRAEAVLGVKEKDFPAETFDHIIDAIKNNQISLKADAFKYLPDTIIDAKVNKTDDKPKPTNLDTDGQPFFTLLPIPNQRDRSFVVPTQ